MNQDHSNINHLWRLVDPIGVQDAAALIAGFEPKSVRFNGRQGAWFENESGSTSNENICWVETALTALTNAIAAGKLKAKSIHDSRPVTNGDHMAVVDLMEATGGYASLDSIADEGESLSQCGDYFIRDEINWEKTTVERKDLIEWLRNMGVTNGFFFPSSNQSTGPDYLDKEHPRYAPKLAAVVLAWESFSELPGKTPKQVLSRWLNENASRFGLIDDEGKPRDKTIEELAAIPNWQTTGGAPKTPTS
jgi:hypothetical protein|nr:hypothetical protein [uncultured Tolumonas sp.]